MRRRLAFVLLCCLCLSACGRALPEGSEYQVYYRPVNGDFQSAALQGQSFVVPEGEEAIDLLLQQLLTAPTAEGLIRSIPEGVTLRGWVLDGGTLTVDFSRRYGTLSGIELTLADYSVTMTLSQVSGVERVVTMVEGDQISYRDRQNLRTEDILPALHRREPVEREVSLWVLTQTESGFTAEKQMKTIALDEDESLTTAVLWALIEQAEADNLLGLPTRMDLITAKVRDGLCSLNLSDSFYEMAAEDREQSLAGLTALVMTLCELDSVDAVRLLREGEPAAQYGAIPIAESLDAEAIAVLGGVPKT